MPRLNEILNIDISDRDLIAYTFDWSGFDYSIPSWLINEAFDILEELIDFDH